MNGCNDNRKLTEIILKMALNQSLQTTQIIFDPNDGIYVCQNPDLW